MGHGGVDHGFAHIDWRDPNPERDHEAPLGLQLHKNNDPEEVRFKDIAIATFPTEDRLVTVKEK